ncbi:MAG TPA: type II CAAX endopeptidase family protein [Candidatus Limnocylindria bacterium]|nr:type II CAAX endopeptidase family protein [Candidatus Limnocylindria bacterium]
MTDPSRPGGSPPDSPDPTAIPDPTATPEAGTSAEAAGTRPARPFGLSTFTIEGRRAPALFVVGWLATFVGGGIAGVTLLGIPGPAGVILWVIGLAVATLGLVLLGGSQAIERRAAGAAYAGPSPLLVFLAVLAGSQVAGFVVGFPLSLIGPDIPPPLGDLIGALVQSAVFAGVLGLMVVAAGALRWREMGLSPGLGNALRGILGGAVFAGPVILVTAILAAVAAQLAGAVPASPLPPTGTTAGLLLHLVAGAVVAPVGEELLFRGFALTAWRRTVGARGAIVRSSIVFVLAHVLFVGGDTFRDAAALAFVAGVARFPVAIALGWLFVRTGSLWGPIGLHAAYNAILIIIAEAFLAT